MHQHNQSDEKELLIIQRDLGIALSETSDLDNALTACINALIRIKSVDYSGIYLLNPLDNHFDLCAHSDFPAQFLNIARRYAPESPQVMFILKKQAFFSSHETIMRVMKLPEHEIRQKLSFGIHALALIPLIHDDEVIGALNAASKDVDQFDEFIQYALESMAWQIAGAVAKIQSFMELKSHQENLKTLFDNLDDFLFVLDEKGMIVEFNPVVSNRLGYTNRELKGMNVLDLHPPERHQEAEKIIAAMLAGKEKHCLVPLLKKDGGLIPVETAVTLGQWNRKKAMFGISRDITESKRKELIIKQTLKEKETLLTELHHRVKNNMQVISSLLKLQASKIDHPPTAKALEEAESRIHSMALVHEILHQSDILSEINLQPYLKKLSQHITELFSDQTRVIVEIDAEPLTLPVKQAINCGLIVTELLTNGFKHAFSSTKRGHGKDNHILLNLGCREQQYSLSVSDNGKGFPEGFHWQMSRSLGLRLVRELVQRELKGELELIEGHGICWIIRWNGN